MTRNKPKTLWNIKQLFLVAVVFIFGFAPQFGNENFMRYGDWMGYRDSETFIFNITGQLYLILNLFSTILIISFSLKNYLIIVFTTYSYWRHLWYSLFCFAALAGICYSMFIFQPPLSLFLSEMLSLSSKSSELVYSYRIFSAGISTIVFFILISIIHFSSKAKLIIKSITLIFLSLIDWSAFFPDIAHIFADEKKRIENEYFE
jgi:hypothetical protein